MQGGISLDKCANEKCSALFRSLGEGKLFVFSVTNPTAWNLPKGLRQKVIWVCDACRKDFFIEINQETCAVELVPREDTKAA
jgi:hypothetical protein